MKYKIAINEMALTGKLPQGDGRWARFNDGFVNQELETVEIANAIYSGRAYTAWHNGRRKDENFICAQHIAVDMETHDKYSSVEYLASIDFVRAYGGLIHTTPSHKPDDPRSRVIFFLDKPISDGAAYEVAARFIYSIFPGADIACIDSSRFFYGALNCQIEWIDNVLPVAHLRSFYARHGKREQPRSRVQAAEQRTATPAATMQAPGKLTPDMFLDWALKDASGEGRNNRGYRLARQLKELGLSQFEAETYIRRYQQSVERTGAHNYTEQEALISLRSAYVRGVTH